MPRTRCAECGARLVPIRLKGDMRFIGHAEDCSQRTEADDHPNAPRVLELARQRS